MKQHQRIEVRPDLAIVAGRHVIVRVRPEEALDVAVQLMNAALRHSLLGAVRAGPTV